MQIKNVHQKVYTKIDTLMKLVIQNVYTQKENVCSTVTCNQKNMHTNEKCGYRKWNWQLKLAHSSEILMLISPHRGAGRAGRCCCLCRADRCIGDSWKTTWLTDTEMASLRVASNAETGKLQEFQKKVRTLTEEMVSGEGGAECQLAARVWAEVI